MLILNSRRAIFVHLHKCAGSSVEVSLAARLRWNDVLLGSTPEGEALQPIYAKLFGLDKHSSAAEIRAVVGDALWSECFTFATVRSPYERLASLYGWIASIVEPGLRATGYPSRAGFEERRSWVKAWRRKPASHWDYPATRAYLLTRGVPDAFSRFLREPILDSEPAFRSQASRLTDAEGRLLVREVVRAEELGREWPRLCERLGLPGLPLLEANVTPNRFRRRFDELTRDPEDVRYVNERFAADFERLGYERR